MGILPMVFLGSPRSSAAAGHDGRLRTNGRYGFPPAELGVVLLVPEVFFVLSSSCLARNGRT